jgi:hypothetical protein
MTNIDDAIDESKPSVKRQLGDNMRLNMLTFVLIQGVRFVLVHLGIHMHPLN